jgi:hypothetical protein
VKRSCRRRGRPFPWWARPAFPKVSCHAGDGRARRRSARPAPNAGRRPR